MKNLLTLILILIPLIDFAQGTEYPHLKKTNKLFYMHPKAGSCGSPDGSMNSVGSPPPSYAWLQSNGYCNPNAYGTNPTVCWTFTPTSSSVTINSGYSQTGCVNIGFGAFNLYGSGCVLLGTGLNFTGLTPGIQYTWCMTGAAWGGGPGCIGFTDFCPYYTNNVVLPVELELFIGVNKNNVNVINWITSTEINNEYFTLERSNDLLYWEILTEINGNGTVNTPSFYEYRDDSYSGYTNYYRLIQHDFNGNKDSLGIISITSDRESYNPIIRIINSLGQEVTNDYNGIIFYIHKNGYVEKKSKKK